MVSKRVMIRPHEYYDSVRLMQVSDMIRNEEGIREAILLMATENNKKLLDVAGLLTVEVQGAAPDDLVVAIVASSDEAADLALEKARRWLARGTGGSAKTTHRTYDSALSVMPQANLALISVPGQYAASEARRALERGLHVMLFSDNVSIEDEVSLKQLACDRGLLLMGPDCGTAIVGGVGLGFANVVGRGPVGLVGASGTGIQEICVLLDHLGIGVSHALGTGGRDLAAGAITMMMGLESLEQDPDTRVIVLTSKPPDAAGARRILDRAAACHKPVVVNFLGGDPHIVSAAGLTPAKTLEDAALQAARLAGSGSGMGQFSPAGESDVQQLAAQAARQLSPGQRYVRGLFSGGTLCYEAMLVLRMLIGDVYSNIPLQPKLRLSDSWHSQQHTLVDLGDDEFTQGRAHPMIDPTLRLQRLVQEAEDPEVAVLLLDVVLGFGSHENPAEGLARTIVRARAKAASNGWRWVVVASVCGTDLDPQQLSRQKEMLAEAGVLVAASNAQAARLAGGIIQASLETD